MDVKSSPEYYQLVDGDVDVVALIPPESESESKQQQLQPNNSSVERIDSFVLLDGKSDNDESIKNRYQPEKSSSSSSSESLTTSTPSTIMDDSEETRGKNSEESTLIKGMLIVVFGSDFEINSFRFFFVHLDLWQVNRRNRNKYKTNGSQSDDVTNSTTIPTTALLFERYANQQQQQTINKRPLRIPKLLLPKVNRPAMYSLNGYVPKPSIQRTQMALSEPYSRKVSVCFFFVLKNFPD